MIKNTHGRGFVCRIGGFCFGFEKQGFKTAWANDFDNQVAKTYEHNFPDTKFIHQDICELILTTLNQSMSYTPGFLAKAFRRLATGWDLTTPWAIVQCNDGQNY